MRFLDEWIAKTVGHANSPENPGNPARGIFVIGTDTEVGKSYVAALLIRHLVAKGQRTGAYKPVASGSALDQTSDAALLMAACGGDWPLEKICPQSFSAPVAPPIAAARNDQTVDDRLLRRGCQWWLGRCDVLVVEGAGGALSPLSQRTTTLDLANEFRYPIVLVARHRLGMINHTLLTLEALERRGLQTLAVIVNEVSASPAETTLAETLSCLRSFCGNLECWVLKHRATTLSRAATSATIQG